MTDNQEIERVLNQLTITPDELHQTRILPGGRSAIYEGCRTGEIESFRIGRRIVIPVAPLRRKLGLDRLA